MGACQKRDAQGWTKAVGIPCFARKANNANATRWARIKVAPLGGARLTASTLPSMMSRFKRDRTALRQIQTTCVKSGPGLGSKPLSLSGSRNFSSACKEVCKVTVGGFHRRSRSCPRWRQPLRPTRSPLLAALSTIDMFGAENVATSAWSGEGFFVRFAQFPGHPFVLSCW